MVGLLKQIRIKESTSLLKNDVGISLNQILGMSPHIALSAAEPNCCFQERTGASAIAIANEGDRVGSFKNLGTLGNWLTAMSDSGRPIRRRAANGKWYLEADGIDDVLRSEVSGALAAVAGWTIIGGIRNTSPTGQDRNFISVMGTSPSVTRALVGFRSTGVLTTAGRRIDANSTSPTDAPNSYPNQDIIATGIGDFTNTDLFLRASKVQVSQTLTWLSAGLTANDGGHYLIFGWNHQSPAGIAAGRIYSMLVFPRTLNTEELALAEAWTAQQMGLTI